MLTMRAEASSVGTLIFCPSVSAWLYQVVNKLEVATLVFGDMLRSIKVQRTQRYRSMISLSHLAPVSMKISTDSSIRARIHPGSVIEEFCKSPWMDAREHTRKRLQEKCQTFDDSLAFGVFSNPLIISPQGL